MIRLPGFEIGQQHIDQMLVIGFTQLRIADQTLNESTFPPELLQQLSVCLSIRILKPHPNPLRQCWAMPSSGNRNLQRATLNDGRSDEITGVRRIDDIHPDAAPPGCLAHSLIHGALISRPNDQLATYHVSLMKGAGLMLDDSLCDKTGEGFGVAGANHDHRCARLQKPLYLASGNFATTDHQTAFAL
jgi:hypothetical protein